MDEWLDFVLRDDMMMESKKQTSLLEKVVENTTPEEEAAHNDWYTVITVDLSSTHDSFEVWHTDETVEVNSVVIPAQDIDYWYELEYGKRVKVEAGLIMEITTHLIEMLRITNEDTSTNDMEIVLSGIKSDAR